PWGDRLCQLAHAFEASAGLSSPLFSNRKLLQLAVEELFRQSSKPGKNLRLEVRNVMEFLSQQLREEGRHHVNIENITSLEQAPPIMELLQCDLDRVFDRNRSQRASATSRFLCWFGRCVITAAAMKSISPSGNTSFK